MGWLTRVEEPSDAGTKVTEYGYDDTGRRTHQKTVQADGQINQIIYTYNKVGQLEREDFGAGLWNAYTYDPNGNLATKQSSDGQSSTYQYDGSNRLERIDYSTGNWVAYTYDGVGNKLSESGPSGTTTYTYTPENWVKTETRPDGTVITYEHDAMGNRTGASGGGGDERVEYDKNNRVREYTDSLGYTYRYDYDDDGYVTEIYLPNGLTTHIRYDARHNIERQWTEGTDGTVVSTGTYDYGARGYREEAQEDGRSFSFGFEGRGQMKQVTNPRGDIIRYYFDGAGNLLMRDAIISGSSVDHGETITIDELMDTLLRTIKEQEGESEAGSEASAESAGGGNGKGKPRTPEEEEVSLMLGGRVIALANRDAFVLLAAKGGQGEEKGNAGGADQGNGGGNGNGNENAGGNGKGQGKPEKQEKPEVKACQGLEHGKGQKVGLYRKCAGELGLKPGLEANLLSIIDNLVNGEYLLPPGDKEELFELVRGTAAGYTIVGTTYTYNEKNQLLTRYNEVRDEEHIYQYDLRGNLLSNGRVTFRWDEENRLIESIFPDGEGVRYAYDTQGRRISKTSYNAYSDVVAPTDVAISHRLWFR